MITSVKKSYIRWDDIYVFIEDNLKTFKKEIGAKSCNDIALFSFYRGGLPMAVTFSNLCENIDINIIKYQTRDGNDIKPLLMNGNNNEVSDTFKWCNENNKKIIIIEDIIDTGKTIDAIIAARNSIKKDLPVTILSLVANDEYVRKLGEKEINFNVIYKYKLDKNSWIVFPWENQK